MGWSRIGGKGEMVGELEPSSLRLEVAVSQAAPTTERPERRRAPVGSVDGGWRTTSIHRFEKSTDSLRE